MDWKQKNITLYGGGLIGSGWAAYYILKEWKNVTLYHRSGEGLSRAKKMIRSALEVFAENGLIEPEAVGEGMDAIAYTTDRERALADADFIQENGPEDLDIRRTVIADIEKFCPKTSIIASSTSSTPIWKMSEFACCPERILGGHPYHPVYLLPLVELVGSHATDKGKLDEAKMLYEQIGKVPVLLKQESPGYIASRLMSALYRECTNIVMSGVAGMEDVDTAFCLGPGLRYALMGPNTVLQLAGGEGGIENLLLGSIGKSGGENTMKALASWEKAPADGAWYYATIRQQMDKLLANRDELHGRSNHEIERFRDAGLIKILMHHGLLA